MSDASLPDTTDVECESLVRAIHASDLRFVLALTGGGSRAIGELLTVPGGSRTVLEAAVPYSAEALTAWLGSRPERFCDERTARAMAMVAYQRARRYAAAEGSQECQASLVGVSCTASLTSDRPKRGAHRVHVALQTADATTTHSLELEKGARTRQQEEQVAAALVLDAVAEAAHLKERVVLLLRAGEEVQSGRTVAPENWKSLLNSAIRCVRHETADSSPVETPPPRGLVVFPGAFDPLHEGHRRMAAIASSIAGRAVEFEISIENVDKPPLDYTEMRRRAAQIADAPLWFTRAATFVEKAALFPEATFVVGVDTLERIGDPRYYGESQTQRDRALRQLADAGCKFLVFGRLDPEGQFRTLDDLELADPLPNLCQQVDARQFRADVSSTELRRTATPLEPPEN